MKLKKKNYEFHSKLMIKYKKSITTLNLSEVNTNNDSTKINCTFGNKLIKRQQQQHLISYDNYTKRATLYLYITCVCMYGKCVSLFCVSGRQLKIITKNKKNNKNEA
ncbi:unnamed protein product [Ceratitis capitata]|uniref:(Mediterranean fruit fly) hypothetical protein n=1 Tax=Ceratitis capitata TaxID=7213 RepID=A0A811VA54_CERCA|nr:unnamed protein product [Ceratitis capitata]